jgi:hypothetical protein
MTDDEERDERGVNLSGQELIAHDFVNVSDQKNPGHLADIARFEIEWNLLTTFGQERDCCWGGGIRLHISEVLIHLVLNNFWMLGRAPLGRTPPGRIDALVHELAVFELSLAISWDFAICCSEIKLPHDSLGQRPRGHIDDGESRTVHVYPVLLIFTDQLCRPTLKDVVCRWAWFLWFSPAMVENLTRDNVAVLIVVLGRCPRTVQYTGRCSKT